MPKMSRTEAACILIGGAVLIASYVVLRSYGWVAVLLGYPPLATLATVASWWALKWDDERG